jgi:hypothetical protein
MTYRYEQLGPHPVPADGFERPILQASGFWVALNSSELSGPSASPRHAQSDGACSSFIHCCQS